MRFGVGQDELAIIVRVQRADPRVEHLHDVHARVDLREEIVGDDVRQKLAEAMPGFRRSVHQRLRMSERGGMSTFDRVGRQRERCARKSDQRDAPGELVLDLTDGIQHVRQLVARIEAAHAGEVGRGAQRPFDLRAFALDEIERDAHVLERQQQIRKQDRGIHVDPAHRLQRDFGREVGRAADVEQRIAFAQRTVLAHVASSLAHEPDWRGVDRLQTTGFQKSGTGVDQWVTLRRLRASPTRSSSHSGLKRSSAPSSRSSFDIASSRK